MLNISVSEFGVFVLKGRSGNGAKAFGVLGFYNWNGAAAYHLKLEILLQVPESLFVGSGVLFGYKPVCAWLPLVEALRV